MMEKHLTNIAINARMYMSRMEAMKQAKKEVQNEERDLRIKHGIFMEKLKAVKLQVMEYRDLLKSYLGDTDIDVRLESREHTPYILRLQHDYKDYILLAVAPKKLELLQRWRYCGFFAICGDFAKDQIDVYEYAEVIDRKNLEQNNEMRNNFKDHSRHLICTPIDKFNFEEIKPLIDQYVSKELCYIGIYY